MENPAPKVRVDACSGVTERIFINPPDQWRIEDCRGDQSFHQRSTLPVVRGIFRVQAQIHCMCLLHLLSDQFLRRLRMQDQSNTHFTLFEFEKTSRKARGEKEWNKMLTKSDILKPCEYKRR